MKFYNLAYKNLRGNLYRYVMYYLSNAFSVMLFFIFANFIYHPAVSALKTSGGAMLYTTSQGLVACQYVIIVFSFFFVSYSNSTFIKSRGKEFGLLSLFGMTKAQIRKYVAYENILVSLLSIALGIVFGGIFSKLFLMAVEGMLGTGPVLNYMIVPKAVLITFVSFFVLFQVINLFSLRRINNRTIVTQLKSVKVPKLVPKFSKALAILGILLVAAGYVIAWISGMYIIVTMFPVLGLTVAGTYFVFTQLSVAVTRGLQKNEGIFYRKTNMIAISQIIYKLRDNAKIMFLIAILGAVTLTAAGTLYSLFDLAEKSAIEAIPQHIGIIEENVSSHDIVGPERVREIMSEKNIKVTKEYEIRGIKGTWEYEGKDKKGRVLAISCSDYNTRAGALGMKYLNINGSDIAVVAIFPWMSSPDKLSFDIQGSIQKDHMVDSLFGKILSSSSDKYPYVAVLSDEHYNSIIRSLPESETAIYYGYDMENWKSAEGAVTKIRDEMPEDKKDALFESVTNYTGVMKSQAIIMMVGLFVALLFLIATGSIIYFKLFTELQSDRAEFISLRKMGMSRREMKRIINVQMVVIFFLPFVIASSHAAFALKALSDILMANITAIGITVILAYLIFQMIYFLIIKWVYGAQLNMAD